MRISTNIKSICLPWMHSMGPCLAGIANFNQEGTVQHLKTAVVPPAPVVLSSGQYIRNAEEEGWAAFLKQLHRNAASLRCNCQALGPDQPHWLVLCQQCLHSPEEEIGRGSNPHDTTQPASRLAGALKESWGRCRWIAAPPEGEKPSLGEMGQGREILLTSKCHLDSEQRFAAFYFLTRKTSSGRWICEPLWNFY